MRPVMAVLLAVGALAQAPICNLAFAAEPIVVDGMAAVVNGEVITYSQVRALSAPEERMLRQQYTGPDLEKKLTELRQLALKDLIDRRLIIQAFKKESYEIPDHLVDQKVQQIIRESFGGDRNTFVKTLEAQNYTLGRVQTKGDGKIYCGRDEEPQRQDEPDHFAHQNRRLLQETSRRIYVKRADQTANDHDFRPQGYGERARTKGTRRRSARQTRRWRGVRADGADVFRGQHEGQWRRLGLDRTEDSGRAAGKIRLQHARRQNQQHHRLRRQLLHPEG